MVDCVCLDQNRRWCLCCCSLCPLDIRTVLASSCIQVCNLEDPSAHTWGARHLKVPAAFLDLGVSMQSPCVYHSAALGSRQRVEHPPSRRIKVKQNGSIARSPGLMKVK